MQINVYEAARISKFSNCYENIPEVWEDLQNTRIPNNVAFFRRCDIVEFQLFNQLKAGVLMNFAKDVVQKQTKKKKV